MIDLRPDSKRTQRHLEDGHWTKGGEPSGVPHALRANAKQTPDKPAAIDRLGTLDYAALEDRVARAANGLSRLGVVAGDAVIVQLPNWNEALVMHLAIESLGAATVPVPPIYRAKDVRHIANVTDAKVAVVPVFGSFDVVGMYRELMPELPKLTTLVVVRHDGADASIDGTT